MKTCGDCKNCHPMNVCGCDCECKAKSDGISFQVSQDDDICFYGDKNDEPCKLFTAR